MDYYKYEVTCAPERTEVLMAILGQLEFDAFEELETGFAAYVPAKDVAAVEAELPAWVERFEIVYERSFVPYKNWNEEWEKHFEPVEVGDFAGIRADFHAPFTEKQFDLVINPKMAFGTGHHETTHMMVQLMEGLPLAGRRVLDYGCGTGILAILARKLGATYVDAVDIEWPSYENTIENAERNEVTGIGVYHGTLSDIEARGFDVILANINRNVILESLPALYAMMVAEGDLLVSGFLEQDRALLEASATEVGFELRDSLGRGNWIAQWYVRR